MSTGHLFVVLGLSLDVLATLFLSLDLRKYQDGFGTYVNIQLHIRRLDDSLSDLQKQIDETPLAGTTPEEIELEEVTRLTIEASADAVRKNRQIAVEQLERWNDDYCTRVPWVKGAIALVVTGGILNLIGVIVFGA